MKTGYHNHTTYSDGDTSPEEMVRGAIAAGMAEIGISDHSFTPFDLSWCIAEDKQETYVKELQGLKKKYAGQISVKCGVEQDLTSPPAPAGLDYRIGSVHWLKCGDAWLQLDHAAEMLKDGIDRYFGGSSDKLAETYFDAVSAFAQRDDITFIGHFDLITKYNERACIVPRTQAFTAAWKKAAAALADAGKIFEINTGAISRGYRTSPYPDDEMIPFLAERGVKFLLSADAHKPANLTFGFDEARARAEALGAVILDKLPE